MARGSKKSKTKSRQTSETSEIPTSSQITLPPEDIRTELTTLIQELLFKTHELSFEYSTSDCNIIMKCGLALKSKEIFKVVKRLNELVKKMQS